MIHADTITQIHNTIILLLYCCLISGSQLPYCRTSDLQCCTTSYLDDLRSKLSLNISTGAQTDLMKALKPWQESYIQLTGIIEASYNNIIVVGYLWQSVCRHDRGLFMAS